MYFLQISVFAWFQRGEGRKINNNKKRDPGPGPGPGPESAFYWHPSQTSICISSPSLRVSMFAYKPIKETKCSGAHWDITTNDTRHISVKTVEYRSCTNFFSGSAPSSVLQKATRQNKNYLKQGFFFSFWTRESQWRVTSLCDTLARFSLFKSGWHEYVFFQS